MSEADELARLQSAFAKTADGVTCIPGMTVYRVYLGSVWTACVVMVGESHCDLQYTNDGSHKAKGCVTRGRLMSEWYSTEVAAKEHCR